MADDKFFFSNVAQILLVGGAFLSIGAGMRYGVWAFFATAGALLLVLGIWLLRI